MSATLRWRITNPPGQSLPDHLKFALRKRIDREGRILVATECDLPYFQGLIDAGIDGAKVVYEAIERYGEIELFETQ